MSQFRPEQSRRTTRAYPVTFSAHTYLYPKHSDWACSVGAKASINAERSCATDSHLSPIFALMLPATAKLRSSSRPNSCKRPRSHSAPWHCCGTLPIADPVTRAATAPLSRTVPSNNRTVAVLQRRASGYATRTKSLFRKHVLLATCTHSNLQCLP